MTSFYDDWYIYYSFCIIHSFCEVLLTHTELTVNKVVKKKDKDSLDIVQIVLVTLIFQPSGPNFILNNNTMKDTQTKD